MHITDIKYVDIPEDLQRKEQRTPCYGCSKREMGCHAKCSEYKEWRAAYDEQKRLRQNKEIAEYATERKARLYRIHRNGSSRRNSALFRNYRR